MATEREAAIEIFSLLGDPTRYELLRQADGKTSVGGLAGLVGVGISAATQHLKLLRQGGLVEVRRDAQTRYYKRIPGALEGALKVLARLAEGG